jgi:uncharacterized protein (TIGR00369 family)
VEDVSTPEFLEGLRSRFGSMIPHVAELGIVLTRVTSEYADAKLPIRPEFIGDLDRRRIHTGVITTLIDSIAGVAVYGRLGKGGQIATLDLRVDYLQSAHADSALHCRAECYRLTTHIAFVRAQVWQDDPEVAVATALATFMRGGSRAAIKTKVTA